MLPNEGQPYPLPVYRYRVTIGNSTLGFSEVSGLSIDREPITYRHGMSFATGSSIIPGMRKEVRLTMKKGTFKGNDFLARWFQDTYTDPSRNSKQDILIDLCDASGQTVIRWKVQGAMPIKFDAPAFNSGSNEVAVEILELIAHDISVDYHP